MLYDPNRHTPLKDEPWSKDQALNVINEIFDHMLAGVDSTGFWPAHPDEDSSLPYNMCLYNGASGNLWGLCKLSQKLSRELPFKPEDFVQEIHKRYLAHPDTEAIVPSLLLGETGILLLRQKISPNESNIQKLRSHIEKNVGNPTNEALWGSPGTMLAALWTEQIDLFKLSADDLFSKWKQNENELWVWTQDLYNQIVQYTGAGHGFFGNIQALLEGQKYLSEEQRKLLFDRTIETSIGSAMRKEGQANWMPRFQHVEGKLPLTQWCHGSPGMILSMRSFPKNYSNEFEQLLLEAGELTWNSGPLKKGIGICHGTDGNGFSFLTLFERTQDELWLTRARKFAMHSLKQRNGRYSLWTGEMGLALYLLACIDAEAGFPTLDYF